MISLPGAKDRPRGSTLEETVIVAPSAVLPRRVRWGRGLKRGSATDLCLDGDLVS